MSVPPRNTSRKQTQEYSRSYLEEYKGPCPFCKHTLKSPTSGRCPECGSRLQVGLFVPFRFTPWHAMLACLGISIGIIIDRVALTIIGMVNSRGMGGAEQMFWFAATPFVVLCFCFYLVWKQKRRINATQTWKRVCWYIASIVIPLVVLFGQLAGLVWLALRV